MVAGFKVDVTAEELVGHLDGRVQYHRQQLQECEAKIRQFQALEEVDDNEEEMFDVCASSRLHGLEWLAARHRSPEVFLMFARNHTAGDEIYRLSYEDLRLLEWLPAEEPGMMVARI